MNLLGLPGMKSLQLLQQVYSVSSLEQTIRENSQRYFRALEPWVLHTQSS